MTALVVRDIRLALARGSVLWVASLSFLLFCALVAIGVGGSTPVLSAIGPGVIWAGVVIATTSALMHAFRDDLQTGAFDYLRLRGNTLQAIVGARILSTLLVTLLPVIILSPVAAQLFGMASQESWRLVASLLCGSPALAAYGVFTSAVIGRAGGGAAIATLIAAPFLVPLVIFGQAAVTETADSLFQLASLRALVGLSLVGCVVSVLASAAALGVNAE